MPIRKIPDEPPKTDERIPVWLTPDDALMLVQGTVTPQAAAAALNALDTCARNSETR